MISTNNIRVKQKSYSQNAEDVFVLEYFKGFKGTLLSVGENNGIDFSNAKLLIEHGFEAYLLEPGSVCADLFLLHKDTPKVHVFNYGIGEQDEVVKFYESGAHVLNGGDTGLVSSTDYEETIRWRNSGVQFDETEIQLISFENFCNAIDSPIFDFISIDAEGYDWRILKQINLTEVGCQALVIEWNSIPALKVQFENYCGLYGLKLAHVNAENLIYTR